jgi:monomeric sarcosine oxidase
VKIAVVGAGAVGSAAARFLAKAGHETFVYEQFQLGHHRGSSHGSSRITRKSYPDPFYTELMHEVYPLWAELEAELSERLYVETGLLNFGVEGNEWMRQTRNSLSASYTSYEPLGPIEVAKRFHGFHLEPDEEAIYQPEAGYLLADRALAGNIAIAKGHGASVFENSRVESIEGGLVNGTRFDAIAVCAGSWVSQFVNAGVTPYLQHFAYFDAPIREEIPVWIDAGNEHYYGFPNYGDGFKVGMHLYGPEADPNQEGKLEPTTIDQIFNAARLRIGAGAVRSAQTCLYTVAPNEDFRIGRIPNSVPTYFVSACSGHGFKFSIWFGKLLQDLVEESVSISDYPRFEAAVD